MLLNQRRSRSRLAQLVFMSGVSLTAVGCAGSPQSAGGPSTPDNGPGGSTPSDAQPADGIPTTTPQLDGPASTSADVAVAGTDSSASCGADTLTVEVEEEAGEAGHQHRRIVLTNSGTLACTVSGYPGVVLLDGNDRPLGLPASREPLAAAPVTLAPGASASAALDQQSPGVFPAEVCGEPVDIATVQVIVPDDAEPIPVAAQGEACPNPVEQLSVRPIQAGRDSQP
jgi:hypothetical protein